MATRRVFENGTLIATETIPDPPPPQPKRMNKAEFEVYAATLQNPTVQDVIDNWPNE